MSLLVGGPPAGPGGHQHSPTLDPASIEELYRPISEPWTRANLVVSLDGAIELDGRSGALGGPDDRVVFAALRAVADVVLVGAGTARGEEYGPTRLPADATARRRARGQASTPPVAVLTNRADLDPDARLFAASTDDPDRPRPLILTCSAAPAAARTALGRRAEVVVCGERDVDLGVALGELRARGMFHVLCEGGPTILTKLLGAGLLDELCLTHAPVVAGPDHLRLVAGEPLRVPVGTTLAHLLAGEGLLFGRYTVDQPGGRP